MNKPEFMLNLTVSHPEIEKSFGAEEKIICKLGVTVVEDFDNAIEKNIIDIAKEEGINSLMLLNKKEIVNAFKKQIPEKVTHEASLVRCCTCPKCKNVVDKFEKWGESTIRITYNYCHFCGQALDWSDTE